jgi:hypothetical protein
MSDQSLDEQEKYISMELRPYTIMCAFFSIQIRRGVKKFRSQAPWAQNWCLVPELVFDSYKASRCKNKSNPPRAPRRNTMFDILVFGCGRIPPGNRAAASFNRVLF